MLPHDHIDGTIGADQEELGPLATAGQPVDQVQGGMVSPVEVLEDQYERPVGAQRFERVGHLPQHPVTGSPEERWLRGFAQLGAYDPRQLFHPGWRVFAEYAKNALRLGPPTKAPDRVQYRQIRLTGPSVLDTEAAGDPGITVFRCSSEKRI